MTAHWVRAGGGAGGGRGRSEGELGAADVAGVRLMARHSGLQRQVLAAYRAVLRGTKFRFFADESNLNLLSASDLRRLCGEIGIAQPAVQGVRLGGWTSNLILFLSKNDSTSRAG